MKGGPTLGVHVEYAINDDKIASIDRYSGRLSAISVGNTVRCRALFKLNLFSVIYIEDNAYSSFPFFMLSLVNCLAKATCDEMIYLDSIVSLFLGVEAHFLLHC